MRKIVIDDVIAAARGRWLEVLGNLEPRLQYAISKKPRHCPCPKRNGKGKDGFRFFSDAEDTGGAISNADGPLPSGFKVLMWIWEVDFPHVMREVDAYLNGYDYDVPSERPKPAYIPKPPKQHDVDYEKRKASYKKIWLESHSFWSDESCLARGYFLGRGINIYAIEEDIFRDIKFHSSMPFWHDGKKIGVFPCIVSLVRYPDGLGASYHRTYLDPSGGKLVTVNENPVEAKKIMSPVTPKSLAGSAIRLGDPSGDEIHITEGLETGLSVVQGIKRGVWVCMSATFLEKFRPPPGVNCVHVWVDKDASKAGEKAASKLEQNLLFHKIDVIEHLPSTELVDGEKSIDWNDELVAFGSVQIKKEFE